MKAGLSTWTGALNLNFANNELTTLPSSLVTHSNRANLLLNVSYNRLHFTTLNSYNNAGFKSPLVVMPQKNVNDELTHTLVIGNPLVLTARPGGTDIKWKKQDASGRWVNLSNDEDGTLQTYTRNTAAKSDEGVYKWALKSVFTDSLFSEPIRIKTSMGLTLDNWAFQYKYDQRKRMTHKKVPGAEWVYMVYDDRDRLVFTQDGEQRKIRQWSYTKYDALNRPIITGLYNHPSSIDQAAMSNLVSTEFFYETFVGSNDGFGYTNTVMPSGTFPGSFEPLTITYYDNYSFLSSDDDSFSFKQGLLPLQKPMVTQVTGQVTGTWVRILGTERQWLRQVNYYDDRYRLIQTIADNHKRGLDIVTNVYDFSGKLKNTKTTSIDHQVLWGSIHHYAKASEGYLQSTNGAATAYGFSSQSIAASSNGWAEFTLSSDVGVATTRIFGLTTGTPATVTYGVRQAMTINPVVSTIQVQEAGVLKGSPITAQSGDIIRIQRVGSTIKYYRNGAEIYSNNSASSAALTAHAVLPAAAAAVFNAKVSIDGPSHSIERKFEYDHAGRLLETWHSLDGAAMILLSKNEYNDLGQLIDKNLHSTDGTNYHQSLDYRYNIRGWLTSINGAKVDEPGKNADDSHIRKDLFGIDLLYNETIGGIGNISMYNGNISAMRWRNNLGLGTTKERAYKFEYDAMNRLQNASQKTFTTEWTSSSAFHESGFTYDLNGNIQSLIRTDENGTQMDNLDYNYGVNDVKSNRLLKVGDSGTTNGFTDALSLDDDYAYDFNGNMIIDKNKAIQAITYNHLNLPVKVTKTTGDYLVYAYDAGGRKLSQQVYNSSNVLKKRSDYKSEWFLENDTLRFANHDEGRSVVEGTWVEAPNLITYPTMASATNYTGLQNTPLASETINGENYVKVTSHLSSPSGGVGIAVQMVSVRGGQQYKVRVKGYRTCTATVTMQIIGYGPSTSNAFITPTRSLPTTDGWIEELFTVPAYMNSIRLSLVFNTGVQTGDVFYVNEVHMQESNVGHGTQVFSQSGYTYEYHLKDHLGNVRMTFTTKDEVDLARATVENENAVAESGEFLNYDKVRKINHPVWDHTYDDITPPEGTTYAMRLNGSENERIGLAKSLSVMPGDVLKLEVYAKYYEAPSGGTPGTFATLMAAILGGTAPAGTFIDGGFYGTGGATTVPYVDLPGKQNESGTPPKAYLNWLVFDRNYNPILSKSGYKRLTVAAREDTTNVDHERIAPPEDIVIGEPGFVYIYLSNENETPVEVYFDDFKVEHIKSPVISSQAYYPFGLTFNSYSRENSTPNQYQFNSKENQDELNLGWLDFGARMYMPDIGRWTTIDPLAERSRRWSPYAFAFNNPTRFMDPDGMEGEDKTENPGPSRREKREAIREQRREIRQARRDGGDGAQTRIQNARDLIKGIKSAYRNGTTINSRDIYNTPGDNSSFAGSMKKSGATGLPLDFTTQQVMTKKVSTTVSGQSSGAGDGEHHSDPIPVPPGTQTATLQVQAYQEPDKFTVTNTSTGGEILTTGSPVQGAVVVGPAPTGSATSVQTNVTPGTTEFTVWNYKLTFNGTAPSNGSTGVKIIKE